MATRLDQQIEQIEHIVEKHLDLCPTTWNGNRCTLTADHVGPHNFGIEFLQTLLNTIM